MDHWDDTQNEEEQPQQTSHKSKKVRLAEENRDIYTKIYGGEYQRWQGRQQKAIDFFLNDQLTEDELADLKAAGMPTFIVNEITPNVEIIKYFLTANNPKWKAIGREGSDTDLAAIHDKMLEYGWDISNGKYLFGRVIQESLVKSMGDIVVYVDQYADGGKGEVKFRCENPFDVYVDPTSTDPLYDDANFILIKKNLTRGDLARMLPDYKTKIMKARGTDEHSVSATERDVDESESIQREDITSISDIAPTDEMDIKNEFIDYYERYQKELVKYRRILIRTQPSKMEMQMIQENVKNMTQQFSEELSKDVADQKITLNDELKRGNISKERAEFESVMLDDEFTKAIEDYRNKSITEAINQLVKEETKLVSEEEYQLLIKNKVMKESIVEATEYWDQKIRVICSVGTDTLLYDVMLPISKYPIIPFPYLHTGTPYPVGAVQLAIGRQQELNKAHQLMLHNASLGGSLRWLAEDGTVDREEWAKYSSAPGSVNFYRKVGEMSEKPTPIYPMMLPGAFYETKQQAKQDLADLMGAIPQMSGKSSEQETYRGLLAMDEFSTRRVRSWMSNVVEPALQRCGEVFTEYAQAVYTAHKVFRIVNPETNEQMMYEINKPIYADFGKVIGKYHDYNSTKFDIKIIAGGSLPSNRWMKLEEYRKWFELGIIDDVAFVQETDIENKEALLERNSLYSKLKGRIAELEEQVKSQQGSIETFHRELERAGIEKQIRVADSEIIRKVADLKAQLTTLEEKRKIEVKNIIEEARREIKNLKKTGQSKKNT